MTDQATYGLQPSPPSGQIRLVGMTANSQTTIPPGYAIESIFIEETAGAAITGGLDIGTAAAGAQVASAVAVGASSLQKVADSALLKSLFSVLVSQNIFFTAHTAWNGASINVQIKLANLN